MDKCCEKGGLCSGLQPWIILEVTAGGFDGPCYIWEEHDLALVYHCYCCCRLYSKQISLLNLLRIKKFQKLSAVFDGEAGAEAGQGGLPEWQNSACGVQTAATSCLAEDDHWERDWDRHCSKTGHQQGEWKSSTLLYVMSTVCVTC